VTRLWRRRVLGLAVVWFVVVLLAWWLRTDPAVTVLAGYLAAGFALSWLVQDLALESQPAHWAGFYSPAPRPRGADPRLSHLHRIVRDAIDKDARNLRRRRPPVDLQQLLADLAAERLESAHGIRLDDARAVELLGPALHDYLSRPPERLGELSRSTLSDHLTRIEAL
jgi:hypothetical protein